MKFGMMFEKKENPKISNNKEKPRKLTKQIYLIR